MPTPEQNSPKQTPHPITVAGKIIAQAKTDIGHVLKDAAHSAILLSVNSALELLMNRLAFLTGVHPAPVVDQQTAFPPVTNFMGETISHPKELKKEDLVPGEADRAIYLQKVDKLYGQFDTIQPEGILNSHTTPEDQMVIRGVAKRAGVEGYQDREMNVAFMEDISKGIKDKAAADAKQKEIDDKLKQQQADKLAADKAAADAKQNGGK